MIPPRRLPPVLAPVLVFAAAAWAAPAAFAQDSVVLSDPAGKDAEKVAIETLRGRLEAFSKDAAEVRHPGAAELLRFKPGALVTAEFARPAKAGPAAGLALVHFNNGDALPAKLVSAAEDKIVFETSSGHRSEVPAAFVRAVEFPAGDLFGTDILGQEADWKADGNRFGGRSQFAIRQGKLTADGYFLRHRELPLPESYTLSLEAGAQDNFGFTFATPSPQMIGRQEGGYFMRVYQNQLQILLQGKETICVAVLPPPAKGATRRRISLAMDGQAKTLTVLVDGKVLQVCPDKRPPGAGKHCSIQGMGGPFTLSRLVLMPKRAAAKAPAADTLTLANRDRVAGKLVSIAGGKAVLECEAGKLEIPLERVGMVEFSSAHGRVPDSKDGARVVFGEGLSVTLRLESIASGRLKGTSAAFGAYETGMDQVERIEFRTLPGRKEGAPAPAPADEGDVFDDGPELRIRPAIQLRGGRGVMIQGGQVIHGGPLIIE